MLYPWSVNLHVISTLVRMHRYYYFRVNTHHDLTQNFIVFKIKVRKSLPESKARVIKRNGEIFRLIFSPNEILACDWQSWINDQLTKVGKYT